MSVNARIPRVYKTAHLGSKLLQSSDIYRPLLRGIEIAPTHTKVRGRADHPTREPEGVIRENCLGGAIIVLVGNGGDEGLDVKLCGAALLTGGVGTLETAAGFLQRSPLAQSGVLDVIKIVLLASTALQRKVGGAEGVGLETPPFQGVVKRSSDHVLFGWLTSENVFNSCSFNNKPTPHNYWGMELHTRLGKGLTHETSLTSQPPVEIGVWKMLYTSLVGEEFNNHHQI